MLRLNNCAICLWKREIACFNIGRVHVGFFFIIIHLNPHFKDIFTIICLYRCVCDINMCRGKSHSKIDAPAWRLWINTNKRSAISRLHKLLIKLVASLNQNLPTHNLGNKNAINTYNIYNRCILHSRPCSGNDHPICKVSISFQKSFTIHVIARTRESLLSCTATEKLQTRGKLKQVNIPVTLIRQPIWSPFHEL